MTLYANSSFATRFARRLVLSSLLQGAELGGGKNFYSDVQDFKWLKKMKSPNFEVFDVAKDEDAVDGSEWEGVIKVGTGKARRKEERKKREEEDRRRKMAEAQQGAGVEQEDDDSEDEL